MSEAGGRSGPCGAGVPGGVLTGLGGETGSVLPTGTILSQAQTAVFEYIEVFYNRQRCHSANGYLAPLAYEQALKASGTLCPEMC